MSSTGAKPITDTNVSVPRAVREASQRADKLHAQQHGEAEPQIAGVPNEPVNIITPPPATAPTPVTPTGNDKPVDWEHRYRSMEGRYDQASGTIQMMAQQLADLNLLVNTMNAAKTTPAPAATAAQAASLLSAQEIQDYGADFLDVVGKKAQEVIGKDIADIKSVIGNLAQKVNGVAATTEKSAFDDMLEFLDKSVDRWRQINVMDQFLSWLRLQDPYSGGIRHELLKAAWARHDGKRVAAFFNGFIADEAAMAQPSSVTPAPAGDKIPAKPLLSDFAAPGRAKTAAAPSSPEKPEFKRSDVAKFYLDVAANKYKGRDADKDRIEQQIFEAGKDGRIVNG